MSLSVLESLLNASVGLCVSWAATWLVLGYTPAQAAAVAMAAASEPAGFAHYILAGAA